MLSIESQRAELQRAFSSVPNIEIVDIIEESFSAKAPGRERFDHMLRLIEHGEAEGIIAWHPDRLARNSIDGGKIIYLLDRMVLKDLKFSTFSFENNPQGKFMLSIIFGYSKYYIDSLSENVKRGNRAKAERGWRPNHAPLGYRNDLVTSTIVKDPERFAMVQRMFDLMLTGAYSPRRICEIARYEWGFRTPKRKRVGGRPLALSATYKILSNPFYAGILVWAGKSYKGAHEPVLTIDKFDRVQALLHRQDRPRPKTRSFAFTGMIRCGECGLLVTAEAKTNRYGYHYAYYHCSKRKIGVRCTQRSISADELEHQIEQWIQGLSIPEKLHQWAFDQLGAGQQERERLLAARRDALQKAANDNARAISNLTALRVRDLINDDEFLIERQKLDREQLRLSQELGGLTRPADTLEPAATLISFSNRAVDWFRQGDHEIKRLILQCVGSNLILKDRNLSIEATKPFQWFSKNTSRTQLCAAVEDIRILLAKNDLETLRVLENLGKLETRLGVKLAAGFRQAA